MQVEPINQAAFWFFGTADNYGHNLGEYAPSLHNLICKTLGLCTYDPSSDLRIFRLNQAQPPGQESFPEAIQEAWKCFSRDPVLHLGHEAYSKKVRLHACICYLSVSQIGQQMLSLELPHSGFLQKAEGVKPEHKEQVQM